MLAWNMYVTITKRNHSVQILLKYSIFLYYYPKTLINLGKSSTVVLCDTWLNQAHNISTLRFELFHILSEHSMDGGVSCLGYHWTSDWNNWLIFLAILQPEWWTHPQYSITSHKNLSPVLLNYWMAMNSKSCFYRAKIKNSQFNKRCCLFL